MKKYSPVMIEWRDSTALQDVWVSESDIDMNKDYTIISVGVFIGKSDRWVVIALGACDGRLLRPFYIPRKTIVEMKVLGDGR